MRIYTILAVFISVLAFGCASKKEARTNKNLPSVTLDPITVVGKPKVYRGSEKREHDLLHTELNVSFNFEKQHLYGKATLVLKPYFYATNRLMLDAKGMDINEIGLVQNGNKQALEYSYDGLKLNITLNQRYTRNDTFTIFIDYTAKPNELELAVESAAITDDKGLYFIDPTDEDKEKPTQIWTQGEPESSSVWFPTIDKPNERCTQEMFITVPNNYLTISNGKLLNQTANINGTRTDNWKQDIPHAPYLFMMTVGEFAEVKDSWNGMSVNYYVEPEYKDVAKAIFGNTPEMLTYFSELLGVTYPWDKYWQVIVRDYVSGAMENTSAVIFGEFVQQTEREMLDRDFEDIVAHELFHHWFGDLVTCESWANLPLNESFATYGEVIWDEYKYGADAGLLKVKQDRDGYFAEAKTKQVDMIRFNHDLPGDMFDGHSYAKGGCILHMLRNYVGDDAFYASLQKYLNDNAYQSVEIHNLRLAFEAVTGEDLNWFFNQWFLSAGHPVLDINYEYTEDSVFVHIEQQASKEEGMLYNLPIAIDIYETETPRREEVTISKKSNTYAFAVNQKPALINVDADKVLLAEVTDGKSKDNWIYQFNHAKNLLDKNNALEALAELEDKDGAIKNVFKQALTDEFWYTRETAVAFYPVNDFTDEDKAQFIKIANTDENTGVRSEALILLAEIGDKDLEETFIKATNDQSYRVIGAGLEGLELLNPTKAMEVAQQHENDESFDVAYAVGSVYANSGDASKASYFVNTVNNATNQYEKYYGVYFYSKLLAKTDRETTLKGIDFIEKFGKGNNGDHTVSVATSALSRIVNGKNERVAEIKKAMKQESNPATKIELENELTDLVFINKRATDALAALKALNKQANH